MPVIYRDYPKGLEEFYIQRMRQTYRARRDLIAGIRTAAQARAYRDRCRKTIHGIFGPMPPKTPLNARTVKVSSFDGYTLDHVLFESRPDFLVSANLYLPSNRTGPVPAVLFTCGHSPNGKAWPLYVETCLRLVGEGYAVLSYDPISQGERNMYSWVQDPASPYRANCCIAHNVAGKQLAACGEFFGSWRAWDGIRGVDYLVSRPEVDAKRLGVTGQSGGGTLSSFLWALEPRLKMVASSCWCTSYLNDIENSMPADSEQYPPGFVAAGLDKIDFFMARAGEPALLLGQENDFFDDRGLKQGFRELRKIHGLVGAPAATCRLTMDTQKHAYSAPNQEAMVAFFNKAAGKPAPAPRPAITVLTDEVVKVTPLGDVHTQGSRYIKDLVADLAKDIVRARPSFALSDLPRRIKRVLKMRAPVKPPHHRRLFQQGQTREGTGQHVFRFVIEPAPGVSCLLRHVTGGDWNPYRLTPAADCHLYLPNLCSQVELDDPVLMKGISDFWMLDVRGLGEGALTSADPLEHYGHEYMMHGHALLYGESLLGDRLTDVLAAVNLLRAEGAKRVHLSGRGQGAILALLAGVLDSSIATVAASGAPDSILQMVCAPLNGWPSVNFPSGVLKQFDLPEVRQFLGKRLVACEAGNPECFMA
jgi:cephalosporin-C deacetylase-like acetyl esterase